MLAKKWVSCAEGCGFALLDARSILAGVLVKRKWAVGGRRAGCRPRRVGKCMRRSRLSGLDWADRLQRVQFVVGCTAPKRDWTAPLNESEGPCLVRQANNPPGRRAGHASTCHVVWGQESVPNRRGGARMCVRIAYARVLACVFKPHIAPTRATSIKQGAVGLAGPPPQRAFTVVSK